MCDFNNLKETFSLSHTCSCTISKITLKHLYLMQVHVGDQTLSAKSETRQYTFNHDNSSASNLVIDSNLRIKC